MGHWVEYLREPEEDTLSTETKTESMTTRASSLTASAARVAPTRAWLDSYSRDSAALESERRTANDPNRRLPRLHR